MVRQQAGALRYAVRMSVVLKYFGQFCLVISALTVAPLAVSLLFGEYHISVRYTIVIAALVALGAALSRLRVPPQVQANEAMVLVASLFLFTPAVMTYPLMSGGLGFLDALFEAVSGATTTGLSTLPSVEGAPSTFLFSRAWMQWYGGLGIVILSLALLVRPGVAAKSLSVTETREEDLVGGTKAYARRVFVVYLVLTGCGVVLLWLLGARPFHALVYTLAAVSTGGFAPHDASLTGLGGWPLEVGVTLLCVAGAIPLLFFYKLVGGHRRVATDTVQLRAILIGGVLITLLVGWCMWRLSGMSWTTVVHHAPVLAFSAQSTAGFSTLDLSTLDAATKSVLIFAMVVGGGVGSTAGGFKIFRILIVVQMLRLAMVRMSVTKHTVLQPRLAGQRLGEAEIQDAFLIILLFVTVIVVSWLPFVIMGYDPLDALFEVVSATGTVGLSARVVGAELPGVLKGILCADMLLGRLEIMAWLLMFNPKTWIGRRMAAS